MKVLLADDHQIVCEGLRQIIERKLDAEIVGSVTDGKQAVKQAQTLQPDMVIMDISMPGLNGVDAARAIQAESPQIKVLILSMHSDEHVIREALEAGCWAYILKDSLLDEIVSAIKVVDRGHRYLSPQVSNIVLDGYLNLDQVKPSKKGRLTSRQRQILQLLTEGHSSKQIALQLNISVKTVDATRLRIMEKTGIHNIAELTKYAVKEGITSLHF